MIVRLCVIKVAWIWSWSEERKKKCFKKKTKETALSRSPGIWNQNDLYSPLNQFKEIEPNSKWDSIAWRSKKKCYRPWHWNNISDLSTYFFFLLIKECFYLNSLRMEFDCVICSSEKILSEFPHLLSFPFVVLCSFTMSYFLQSQNKLYLCRIIW